MRNFRLLCLMATTFIPTSMFAASVFDGTWKQDVSTGKITGNLVIISVKHDTYNCSSCNPPVQVKADAMDHPVAGHPGYDTLAVNVINSNTITEIEKLGGKTVSDMTWAVAADGKTANGIWRDMHAGSVTPVIGKTDLVRVSAGPAGAHAISGAWKISGINNVSQAGLIITFKVANGAVSMSMPTGEGYAAAINGPDAPFNGDPNIQTVSIKMPSDHEIVETDKRNGKVVAIADLVVRSDGKSMDLISTNKVAGRTFQFVANKQ